MSAAIQRCPVCGGSQFHSKAILWEALIKAWELSEDETGYIDRQQGTSCARCGCNLRSMALAKGILSIHGGRGTFRSYLLSPSAWLCRVLEINGAGPLTRFLRLMPRRKLAMYPEVDMQRMPYADDTYDLVVHSDTLEHVPDPGAGLRECFRVLRPGGWCCFTVPIITQRMSRSTKGRPPSYHGQADLIDEGMRVQTEFGSDVWELVLATGFDECRIVTAEFPSAQAIVARKPSR